MAVRDASITVVGEDYVIAVNANSDVVGGVEPIQLCFRRNVFGEPVKDGFLKLGTGFFTAEQPFVLKLDDHLVVARVRTATFSVESDPKFVLYFVEPAK